MTKRVVGVDINPRYIEEVHRRFGALPGLELHCRNLAEQHLSLAPVAEKFGLAEEEHRSLPGGKAFWPGVFARNK